MSKFKEQFTIKQIKEMQHCISEDNRNFFETPKNESWEDLLIRGYAERKNIFDQNVYFLTKKGKAILILVERSQLVEICKTAPLDTTITLTIG